MSREGGRPEMGERATHWLLIAGAGAGDAIGALSTAAIMSIRSRLHSLWLASAEAEGYFQRWGLGHPT
ncbi:hypothetical protein ABZP36_021624 [Zizania latifolia]